MITNTELLSELNMDRRITKYNQEQNKVLSRQQTSLLLHPHKRNNVNEIYKNPLCAYLTTWRLGPPRGGDLNNEVYKVESNHWEINHTKLWYYWFSANLSLAKCLFSFDSLDSVQIDNLPNVCSLLIVLIQQELITCQMFVLFW